MNMVTRSGGNRFSGTQAGYFMNESMQGDNLDSDLRSRLGLDPTDTSGVGGNKIDRSWDMNATLGGPIVGDKVWFFGSGRLWRLDEWVTGAFNLDGSPVINDNRITNLMGKMTWQVAPSTRFFVMGNKNWKYRWHRNLTAEPFASEQATNAQLQPAQNYVASVNHVFGTSAVVDVRFGRMWGVTPYFYNEAVGPDDIAFRDSGTGEALRAGDSFYQNPNHRYQFNVNLSYFKDNFAGGTHDFKLGLQIGRDRMLEDEIINHDMRLNAIDGVADEVTLFNTPYTSDTHIDDTAFFLQDAWTIADRLTLNVGVRIDVHYGWVPAQSSPAGTWVGERSFDAIPGNIPDWGPDIAPRIGASYDVFGDGRTAIKGYFGRFYVISGTMLPSGVNPTFSSSVNVPWNDLNGDLFLAPGPSGGFTDSPELDLTRFYAEGFTGGTSTTVDPNLERPYVDEFDIGISHEVMADFSLGVFYHRRHHRRGMGRPSRARPTSAYSPTTATYDDPVDGPGQTITVYDLDPAYLVPKDLIITNVDQAESTYNGIEIIAKKRMSTKWQMLAGITFSKHQGFDQSDSYYTSIDFNDPNALINRDNGSVWTDLPWTFKLSGSYQLPYDIMLAGKYDARAGDPINRTLRVTGLTQGSATIRVAQRGVDRTEAVTQFVDLSISKSFQIGESARLEPMLQIFNLLNANHVRGQRDRIGSTWSKPSRILAPRIIRLGIKWIF